MKNQRAIKFGIKISYVSTNLWVKPCITDKPFWSSLKRSQISVLVFIGDSSILRTIMKEQFVMISVIHENSALIPFQCLRVTYSAETRFRLIMDWDAVTWMAVIRAASLTLLVSPTENTKYPYFTYVKAVKGFSPFNTFFIRKFHMILLLKLSKILFSLRKVYIMIDLCIKILIASSTVLSILHSTAWILKLIKNENE